MVLAISGFAADLSKRDVDKARQAWMSGYLKIQTAAKAANEKQLMFALELYEEALATFQEVQVRYPTWQPDVVNYRINFCTEQVRALREAVEVDAEKMSRPDLIRTVKRLRKGRDSFEGIKKKLQEDLKTAQQEIETLKGKTADLASAQAEADKLKAAAQAEVEKLKQANEALVAEKGALESQIADLNKQVAEAKADAAKQVAAAKAAMEKAAADDVAKLNEKLSKAESEAAEAKALKKELSAKTKEADKAQSEAADAKKEIAKLEGALKAARDEAAALKTQVKALANAQQSADTSSAALLKSQAECKALASKLDAATKAAAELRDANAEKATQLAKLQAANKELDTQLATATGLAATRATTLAKVNATLGERDEKIKKLEKMVEQTDAYDIDKLATQARTATADLQKSQAKLSELQKALLARTEAEKRLIAERNKRIEAEREAAKAKRAREEQLHKYLTDAAAAREKGKSDDALWNLRKVLEMDPDNLQAISHIGFIQAGLGRNAEAEAMLTKAYKLDPTNEDVLYRLGYVQFNQDKMAAAMSTLMQGAQVAPKRGDFRRLAGIACRSLGWPVASEMQLKKAFELDPKDADSAFNLAVLLATLDEPRTDEAREWYKKALALGAKPDAGLDKFFKEN
jgi:Flp pilus assembly protein TadD